MELSKTLLPGRLETIHYIRGRLFRVLLDRHDGLLGDDVLVPKHVSIPCSTPENPEASVAELDGLELTWHPCLGFSELSEQRFYPNDYPIFLRRILANGLSKNDEFWLLADKFESPAGG